MPLSRRQLLPLPLLVLAPAALVGCKSAGIRDAYTARDSIGRLKTKSFDRVDTEIHLIVEFVSGREDAVLIIDLFVPPGSTAKFDQYEIAPGKGETNIRVALAIENPETGSFETKGPWDPGHYEADLLIDGEYDRTVAFDVLG